MKPILAALALSPLVVGCTAVKSEVREYDPAQSAQAFELLKSLEGRWQGSVATGDHPGTIDLSYEVVSSGSVVMERLRMGSESEMISMYHRDGDRLLMTHYCGQGNQPRMALAGFSQFHGGMASFTLVDSTNWKGPEELLMHDVTLIATDKNQLDATWSAWVNGKPDHSATFNFRRVP